MLWHFRKPSHAVAPSVHGGDWGGGGGGGSDGEGGEGGEDEVDLQMHFAYEEHEA